MSFLYSWLTSATSDFDENSNSPSDDNIRQIENLVDRLSTSKNRCDRIEALNLLNDFAAGNYRVHVGTKCLDIVANILSDEVDSDDLLCPAMDLLLKITKNTHTPEPLTKISFSNEKDSLFDIGSQFCEIYLKKQKNLEIITDLLSSADLQVVWSALNILITLCQSQLSTVQSTLLLLPESLNKICALLSKPSEIIRNNTLVLLSYISYNNCSIQKILVYHNTFGSLFDIIETEGYSSGSVVVHDALLIMEHLLIDNFLNQDQFRDSLPRLVPFFNIENTEEVAKFWTEVRILNMICALKILQVLLVSSYQKSFTSSFKLLISQLGILGLILKMIIMNDVPSLVFTECIYVIGDSLHNCEVNRVKISNANIGVPSQSDKSSNSDLVKQKLPLYFILTLMNTKVTSNVRIACFYTLMTFVHKNKDVIRKLDKLFDSGNTEEQNEYCEFRNSLLYGLICNDCFNLWASCAIFYELLIDNSLLASNITTFNFSHDETNNICFADYLIETLINNDQLQVKVGIICLLTIWIFQSISAFNYFLGNSDLFTLLFSGFENNNKTESKLLNGLLCILLSCCIVSADKFDSGANESAYLPLYTKDYLINLVSLKYETKSFLKMVDFVFKNDEFISASKSRRVEVKNNLENVLFHYTYTKKAKVIETEIKFLLASNGFASENNQVKKNQNSQNIQDLEKNEYLKRIEYLEKKCEVSETEIINYCKEIEKYKSKIEYLSDLLQHPQKNMLLTSEEKISEILPGNNSFGMVDAIRQADPDSKSYYVSYMENYQNKNTYYGPIKLSFFQFFKE